MTIEKKTYRGRRKLYKRPADYGKPKTYKRGKLWWWEDNDQFDQGGYRAWAEAEMARRAYWHARVKR